MECLFVGEGCTVTSLISDRVIYLHPLDPYMARKPVDVEINNSRQESLHLELVILCYRYFIEIIFML
jgi:hypothetical protein